MKYYKRIIVCFFSLVILSLHSCDTDVPNLTENDDALPLIILIGQSNAEGWAPKSIAPQWLKSINYKVDNYLIWNKQSKIFQPYELGVNVGSNNNSDDRFGFDVFFAKKYIETNGKKLYCIKQTLGSIPISEKGSPQEARWQPKVELIRKGERKMVEELADKIKEAKDFAFRNNLKLKPIAVLFHQGEGDADEPQRLENYKENFTSLLFYIRTLLLSPNIPFINAEIIYRDTNCLKVNSIFYEVGKNDKYLRTVNISSNQESIGDKLHFNTSDCNYIGNKMFEYYQELK